MASELEQLARIQQAHHRRLLALQDTTGELVGAQWDRYAGLDDAALAGFSASAAVVVDAAKLQTSTLAVGYMGANDRLGGFPATDLAPEVPIIRNGIATDEVYARSVVQARRQVAAGAPFDQAMEAGRSRAVQTARTDVVLSNRAAMQAGAEVRPWVIGYRRVLTGKSCAFCATASTQRYRRPELLPLHPSCDCDVAEIFGTEDPGRVINQDMLDELKAAGGADGRPDYWNGPYVVEDNGAIHYRKVETITGPDGKPLLGPNGDPLRRVVAGPKVILEVVEHGELGPLLTDSHHATTTVADLAPADRPITAPDIARAPAGAPPSTTPPAPPAPPAPELASGAAERRALEDRARASARTKLTAESPEVQRVAEKYGIHPDEVLTARRRVAEVRAVAREEAAKVQADAFGELDQLDTIRLKNPPRIGSKTSSGSAARRGEFDWLEQVSDKEKGRLSRQWYGGTQTPDQFAELMSQHYQRDFTVDEAMEHWLDLNRRSEAAGALRRGKLPSIEAYSGQIDANQLAPQLSGEGYDIFRLFGDDLDAAGHIAKVDADVVRAEALDYLGASADPVLGPSPYRMSFQSWEAEVRDLEFSIDRATASAADLERYAELVPQYIDEAGLDFEELYARIVSTARKAGEEVPDYATIPWS